MRAVLTGVASTAIPMFLRSSMGQKLLSKVGLDSGMFSQPDPFHTAPSMDMYQRDYVTRAEMNYMGPGAIGHLQQAARNNQNIHIVKRKKKAHKKTKKR